MNFISQDRASERGYLIVLCLIMVLVLCSIAVSVGAVISAQYATIKQSSRVESAVMVAEAGVSDTIARLYADEAFTGYPDNARKQLFSSTEQGKGEYSSTVTEPTDDTRIITSVGYLYKDPTTTANEIKKTIKVTVKAQMDPTKYSVFSGPGGLILGGGVHMLGSDIYVQGKVQIGLASGIGNYNNPVNLHVGNIACRAGGVGSQYPVACPVGDQPISFTNPGVLWGSIYGEVCATGQTTGTGIYPGVIGQGFIYPCTSSFGSMPLFDKQAFVTAMNTPVLPPEDANCDGPGNEVDWEAGAVFDGNVSFAAVCKVTVKGNVYIKGSLSSNIFIHFIVDEDTEEPPVIVVNGDVNINRSRVNANSDGVNMRIIGFDSTNSSCSTSDSCNSLSYDHAYSSASRETSSCLGLPHGDMPGLILQSYFGKVLVDNGCRLGSVAGQTVQFDFFSGTQIVGQLALEGSLTIANWKIVDYQQSY